MREKTKSGLAAIAAIGSVAAIVTVAALAGASSGVRDSDRQPAESERLTEDGVKRSFDTIDHSHDGKIDRAEADKAEPLRGVFEKADLDESGSLDADEFREQIAVATLKSSGKVDDAVLRKVRESRETDAKFALGDKAMEALDADTNGAVSSAELRAKIPARRKNFAAWAEPLFTTTDANRDGGLAADEWPVFQKALRDWALVGGQIPLDKLAPPEKKP